MPHSADDAVNAYGNAAFSGRGAGVGLFLDAVAPRIAQRERARILDLGCGTGDVAIALARSFPNAEIIGLDISAANIETAGKQALALPPEQRPSFVTGDYTTWSDGAFDFILADSVLHLVPMDDAALARKLAADMANGGQLLATVPVACTVNSLILAQRRLWRLTPAAFDRLALAIARRMHSGEDASLLAHRIPYLRVIPERILDDAVLAQLKEAGLALVERSDWASPSFFKLRHQFVVLAKG